MKENRRGGQGFPDFDPEMFADVREFLVSAGIDGEIATVNRRSRPDSADASYSVTLRDGREIPLPTEDRRCST